MPEPLRVTPLSPSGPTARLDEFVWGGERADLGVWEDRDGARILVRSRVRRDADGVRRRVRVRSHLGSETHRELDRVTFELHPDRFVELAPVRDGGTRRLELPARLDRDRAVLPDPSEPTTVTLRYVGTVRLELAGVCTEREALLLRLGDDRGGWDQWMVRGVGEVALGPADAAPHRWLSAWRAGDQSDLLFASPRG
jgi:hypothetical protein